LILDPDERHSGEPLDSRAAQELEKQRLDLVVAVVGKHDVIAVLAREDRIARRARRCLEAVASPHSDLYALEWNAARAAETPAECFPAPRVGTQLVIDVQRREPELQLARDALQAVQQNHGVDAA
jgi:hypothetical protein